MQAPVEIRGGKSDLVIPRGSCRAPVPRNNAAHLYSRLTNRRSFFLTGRCRCARLLPVRHFLTAACAIPGVKPAGAEPVPHF